MIRFLRLFFILALLSSVTACSALIIASGTDESEFVTAGAQREHVAKVLGEPLEVVRLASPLSITELRRTVRQPDLRVINHRTHAESATVVDTNAVEKAVYRFKGNVQMKHDVGEAVSLNLMTLGLGEILLIPAAVHERSTDSRFEFVVWFNESEEALAYTVERLRPSGAGR